MLRSFISLLLLLAATAGFAQDIVTIKGNVNGDTKGYNKIYLYGKDIANDSAVLHDGEFEFHFPYVKDCVPVLYTEYEAKVRKAVSPFSAAIGGPCNLYLKDVDITKGMGSGTWQGDVSAEQCQAFTKKERLLSDSINQVLKQKFPDGSLRDAGYRAAYDSMYKAGTTVMLRSFVKTHPDLYAAPVLLRGHRSMLDIRDLKGMYAVLSRTQKATAPGKNVGDYLLGVKNSNVGRKVKDFVLPTPEEEMLRFASLKGKYVLIDFWASWCGPCKASFPHMKEIYSKYKGDRFEIYSISIDQSKEAWLKELKKQELPWPQALDTKNISQSGFAVIAVPTTYLIDPDGKIIMKETGFDSSGNGALEKKLDELFTH